MNFKKDAVKLFVMLALSQDSVSGFISSSCRTRGSWGLSTIQKNTLQTCLGVSAAPSSAMGSTDDDVIEYDFEDEGEEYDYDELMEKKSEWLKELRSLSRTSAYDSSAVEQAQAIFDDMFESYVLSEESAMWPTVDVYNYLIETYAYSKSPDGAKEAENILSKMEDETNEFVARPDLKTYTNVMDAWAMRRDMGKVQEILERYEARLADTDDESLHPAVEAKNKLIKAYGITGEAEKCEEILRELLEEEGDLKANQKTWVQTMKAYLQTENGPAKIQELFREMRKAFRMGEEEYLPKTEAYNVLIRSLSQKKGGAEEAEAMLFEMIEQFRDGDEDMRPDADTFRGVINALKTRKNASGAKIEQLLQIQEGLYVSTKEEDLKLDSRTYNVALGVIARSRDTKKAVRAKRVFDRIKANQSGDNVPSVRAYYTLLSACAYTDGSTEENFEAFQIAVDALKEVRESLNRDPDSGCFGMFLKACANLMPESRKRDALAKNVFDKCCSEGLVNDFVLSEFERASSAALELEALGGFLDDGVRIPERWSRNVQAK